MHTGFFQVGKGESELGPQTKDKVAHRFTTRSCLLDLRHLPRQGPPHGLQFRHRTNRFVGVVRFVQG